eukprot:Em0014g292a
MICHMSDQHQVQYSCCYQMLEDIVLLATGTLEVVIMKGMSVYHHLHLRRRSKLKRAISTSSDKGAVNSQVTGSSQPTLMQLTFFPQPFVVDGENGRLKIVQRTTNHYAELGMHLLDDRNGDTIASQEEQFQRNPVKIATAVYKNWISGTGRKPISWRTLLACHRKRTTKCPSIAAKLNTRAMPTSVNEEEGNKLFDRGSHGTCSKENKRVPFQICTHWHRGEIIGLVKEVTQQSLG